MAAIQRVAKRLFGKGLIAIVTFLIPPLAIEWVTPSGSLPHCLQFDWAKGFTESHFIDTFFLSAKLCWQEWICIILYIIVCLQIEYLLTAHGPNDELSQLNRGKLTACELSEFFKRGDLWELAIYVFLFLYISTCALCERTQLGAISGLDSFAAVCRIIGMAAQIYFLINTVMVIQPAIKLNGMLTREQISKSCFLLIGSLAGMSLTFLSWLPLLALPGAAVVVSWISENSKQKSEFEEFLG